MPDTGCGNCGSFPGSPSYPCSINQISDGDNVDAATTNTPLSELAERTEYLRCFLESLELGTAHIIKDVALASDLEIGHVVYYNVDDNNYQKAIVNIEGRDVYDNESKDIFTLDSSINDSSYPFGIVVEAGTNTAVCVGGRFKSNNYETGLIENLLLDFENLTPTQKVGQMYLEMGNENTPTAGTVKKKKPPLGVPICFVTPDPANTGKFIVDVRPNLHDLMLAHRHYSFKLTNTAALNFAVGYNGNSSTTASVPSGTWSITAGSEEEVDVYLYTYSASDGPGTPSNCPYTVNTADGSVLEKVGTAKYAGNDSGGRGGMIHSFEGNDKYVQFILEDAECIAQDDTIPDAFTAFLKVWDRGGRVVKKGEASSAADNIKIFQTGTNESGGFTAMHAAGEAPFIREVNSSTGKNEYRLNLNFLNSGLAGWLPCDAENCAGDASAAKFYYNIDADAVLSAVWPPYPVQSSVLTINGALAHTSQLQISREGIFWFDDTEDGTPFSFMFPDVNSPDKEEWNQQYFGEMLDKEALLYYTILATSTDEAVVQSLAPKDGSLIKVTDLNGADATTGNLIIDAEFGLSSDSPVAGSLVVKDIDGFAMKKGNVVEKIKAGPLITVSSTVSGGQGEVTISAADFGGVRESEPDLFFADDILLERHEDIFYKVFPSGRDSAITGKVFVPTFLPTSNGEVYNITLMAQIMTPSAGSSISLPNLTSRYKVIDTVLAADNAYEGATGSITGAPFTAHTVPVSSGTFNQYGFKVFKLTGSTPVVVTPGDTFTFKLERAGATDGNSNKVALLDVRYQISKA